MKRINQHTDTLTEPDSSFLNRYLFIFILLLLPSLSFGSEKYEVYRGFFRGETELAGAVTLERSSSASHSQYSMKASLQSALCYEVPTAEELLRIPMLSDLIAALNYSTLEFAEVSKYIYTPFKLTSTISLNWFDCNQHPHSLNLTFTTGKRVSSDLYELKLSATSNINESKNTFSATAHIVIPFSSASNNIFFSFTELLWGSEASAFRNITPSVLAPASHSLSLFTETSSVNQIYIMDPLVQPSFHNENFLYYSLTTESFSPTSSHPLGTMELLRGRKGTEYERKLLGWRLASTDTGRSLLFIRSYMDLKKPQRKAIKTTASSSRLVFHKREKSNSESELETGTEKPSQEFRRQRSHSMTPGAVYVPLYASICEMTYSYINAGKSNTLFNNPLSANLLCNAMALGIQQLSW
jgi:hypothetical protein